MSFGPNLNTQNVLILAYCEKTCLMLAINLGETEAPPPILNTCEQLFTGRQTLTPQNKLCELMNLVGITQSKLHWFLMASFTIKIKLLL